MSPKFFRLGLLAAFVLQAALLAWMIVDRALLLKNGKEVRLAVVPVDPRDLLRGDYVILSYPMSRIMSDEIDGDDDFNYYDTVYVTVAEAPDGWQATSIYGAPPPEGVFLKGLVENIYVRDSCKVAAPCTEYQIAYNLEQFFVPEGEGRELETLRNDQRMSVDVAVAGNGRSALKRLLVDGEVRYEEQLY
jgi:uncharacterized membrane-anchored protein